ncbi:hypothetical protein NECAME_05799 [Necator americanus]|uniref:Uncharacterized protein n=1 Tax=Necator americanus TaxID=51031 RepID=W2U0I8_NECAM|nr:hypothetical protein NECAME_05799 [Necator americanus]ETN86807.1 hypothetical protein NECAME_05799 [Necator americanus]
MLKFITSFKYRRRRLINRDDLQRDREPSTSTSSIKSSSGKILLYNTSVYASECCSGPEMKFWERFVFVLENRKSKRKGGKHS